MTSPSPSTHTHPSQPEPVDPDPEIAAKFVLHRLTRTVEELADTFAALQQMHTRAQAAEKRIGELEELIRILQKPDATAT